MPTALSKSALGALNRLVAGVADIPATYLAAWKERLEDTKYERRHFRRALVDAAALKASADPALIDRTIERLLTDQARKQTNREAVARQTLALLTSEIGDEKDVESREVDEDWLNSFETFAEDASSERMQHLWGRVLAGEIQRPGSFSRMTLRFLHELDKRSAEAFQAAARYAVAGQIFAPEKDGELFKCLLHLEAAGIVSAVGGLVQWQTTTDERGRFFVCGEKLGLMGLTEPDVEIALSACPLTQSGNELLRIVPNPDEGFTLRAIAEQLQHPNGFLNKIEVKGVCLGELVASPKGRLFRSIEQLWGVGPQEDGQEKDKEAVTE